jgi:hypothetical protein
MTPVLTKINSRSPLFSGGSRFGSNEEGFSSPASLFWSDGLGIDIAHVAPEGRSITNEDYESRRAFYSRLYENSASGNGYSFIGDGYVYESVRICRIHPLAPSPTRCLPAITLRSRRACFLVCCPGNT